MANIQEDVTRETWELFLKFLGTGAEFIYHIGHEGNVLLKQGNNFTKEFLLALINKQKEKGDPTDITARMLDRERKGESIHTMLIAEEDAADLSRYLQDKGILFSTVDNPSDDTKVFLYMSGDAEKLVDVVTLWQAEKGIVSELNPELFLDNYLKEGVGTLTGLDSADLLIFRDYAKEHGLVFSSARISGNDQFMIIYDPKDKDTVRKVMDATLWTFSGKVGSALKERMLDFTQNRQKLNRSFLEEDKEFYIVNGAAPDCFVHVTANDFTYCKNFKEVSNVSRGSDDFMDRGQRVLDGMSQPVLLTKTEFELVDFFGKPDMDAIAKAVAAKAKDVPDMDRMRELQDERNRKLELLQGKMVLDDENNNNFWVFDESIDYGSGDSYETLEDLDEQEREDVMDARAKASRYQLREVDAVDHRSLDYFIAEAEKQRSQTEERSPEREHDR